MMCVVRRDIPILVTAEKVATSDLTVFGHGNSWPITRICH